MTRFHTAAAGAAIASKLLQSGYRRVWGVSRGVYADGEGTEARPRVDTYVPADEPPSSERPTIICLRHRFAGSSGERWEFFAPCGPRTFKLALLAGDCAAVRSFTDDLEREA